MILITGRTFEHRSEIHAAGGRWDSVRKGWTIERAISPARLAHLQSLIGVIVTELDDKPPVAPTITDKTAIYGDDKTYFNYFARQNPAAFFGFSSLAAVVRYIESLPDHFATDNRRSGWELGGAAGYGTDNMMAALAIARKGWPEGAAMAERIAEQLSGEKPRVRRHKSAVAGGSVNVGRMLAGNPAHMVARPKQPGRRVVTLFVEAGCLGSINPGTMARRAAVIGAVCDIMENQGYACGIVATDCSVEGAACPYQLAVTIKNAGERIALGDLMFSLGHPSFLRRFSFAICSSVPETRAIWESQGSPANAFKPSHPCGPAEFYFPVIRTNTKTIAETFSATVPENLKITLDD